MPSLLLIAVFMAAAAAPSADPWKDLWKARDQQDRAALQRLATEAAAKAEKHASDAETQYRSALAQSALAEVATEVRDKAQARAAAEAGIKAAERAVSIKPDQAEYHRLLGTLCGQDAAATGGLGALKYGRCALDEVNKALEIDPKSALNHMSHGVGNYYLPQALGGGVDLAIKDFQDALSLDAKSPEAHLWLGVALRKAESQYGGAQGTGESRTPESRAHWAKEQLAKTPLN